LAKTVNGASKLQSTSHHLVFWLTNFWTGARWRLTSNHSDSVSVSHADYADYARPKIMVNFSGITMAVRSSVGVSSVTDLGTGRYRINFSTALSDANYVVITTLGSTTTSNYNNDTDAFPLNTLTTSVELLLANENDTVSDVDLICVAIFV